jgi:hypothetical protein
MSIDKQEIDAVIGDVEKSDLRPSHQKDIRRSLLLARTAINGAPDKIQAICEAVAGLTINYANDAMYRRADMQELIDVALNRHTSNCPIIKTEDSKGNTTFNLQGYKVSGRGTVMSVIAVCVTVCWIGFIVAKGAKII